MALFPMLLMRMVWVILVVPIPHALGAKGKYIDTASSVPWGQTFHAAKVVHDLEKYVDGWKGCQDLHALDLFGRSGRISTMWNGQGFRALAWDLALDSCMDITSRSGFGHLLECGLRLVDNSVIVAGPPCSMFVFFSSSNHRRHEVGIMGDPNSPPTRLSNLICENMSIILMLLRRKVFFHLVVEQPGSSVMYKLPCMLTLAAAFGASMVFTWLGMFGHALCKPTRLLGTLPNLSTLKRTLTKACRLAIKKRQEKAAKKAKNRGQKPKVYYKFHANGSVSGGKDLGETATYPMQFAWHLFALWHENWVNIQ